jgi:hypothetical protein
MRLSTHSFAVLMMAAGIPAAAEDLTIISKVTSDKNPPTISTSYLASDHIRMAHGDGHEVLMDLKTGDSTTLDNKKKEYYVVTKADMQAMAAKMQEQMNSPEVKKAQEQMKSLPPDMQKKMESMMGGAMAMDVRKLGTSRKIAGYSCDDWSMTMGEISKTQECLTTELQFPVQAFEAYKGFAESLKGMMQSMGPMAKGMGQMQEKMKEMKGFPLATTTSVSVMGHASNRSSEVTEIKRGPIPASAWVIPADYTKVDNPMLKALQRKSK